MPVVVLVDGRNATYTGNDAPGCSLIGNGGLLGVLKSPRSSPGRMIWFTVSGASPLFFTIGTRVRLEAPFTALTRIVASFVVTVAPETSLDSSGFSTVMGSPPYSAT